MVRLCIHQVHYPGRRKSPGDRFRRARESGRIRPSGGVSAPCHYPGLSRRQGDAALPDAYLKHRFTIPQQASSNVSQDRWGQSRGAPVAWGHRRRCQTPLPRPCAYLHRRRRASEGLPGGSRRQVIQYVGRVGAARLTAIGRGVRRGPLALLVRREQASVFPELKLHRHRPTSTSGPPIPGQARPMPGQRVPQVEGQSSAAD